MSQGTGKNLKVMGETQSHGGTFDKVRIMGECTIMGSAEADSFKVMGECSVSGNLSSNLFKNMGEVTIDGNLAAHTVQLMGQTQVHGQCVLQQSSVYGECTVGKSLTGEAMKLRGVLSVAGDVSLESLDMRGGINVEGLLNCGTVDMILKFNAINKVKEIGAGRISVKRKQSLFGASPTRRLRVETIEGDQISLEDTEAKIVRGTDVVIGDGCTVDRVEYSGSYLTSGTYRVGEAVRVTTDKKYGPGEDDENGC
ncbi:hypothetical protein [Sporolactobacillus inulinus]|uniref:Uncharacterized protein n=2 Tax=Sporolactobacillus inulinus TaxID=2078 RepID=A0A4Y1Z9C2_9BACL|nr:hypothetical protein [Sporolactobacillus inulinus]KLI03888.1 hypothetical protein SINU_00565 [Sporolactobacillus inulinus CASD]GAY75501.1 hypothetical protein NBRC111894_1055 [Sporolactobacillus inulinus]GEB78233.1 hypothetical protein SIN01_25780 [Sporolactobacillus inulinus]